MQPIIRRMITVTITETWTITWPDGQETVWQETQEVAWPTVNEPGIPLPEILEGDEQADRLLDPGAANQTVDDA
jgi:hypothetical protein